MSKNRKKPIKGKKLAPGQLQSEILRLLKRHPKKRMNARQIIRKLKIANNSDVVAAAADRLVKKGLLANVEENKYQMNSQASLPVDNRTYSGIVDMTKKGSAYIVCEDLDEDVHVAAKYMNNALNGDKVLIRSWLPKGRRRREGEVLEVLERATTQFIGIIYIYGTKAIVVPEGSADIEIVIPHDRTKDAQNGEMVVVEITEWIGGNNNVNLGKVLAVLGKQGSSDIDMKAILVNNGFNLEFPEEVIYESESLETEITEDEVATRRDMREVITFTIDPETAKDFDDALSLEYLDNGNFEIGIHIADVAHYVQHDTALDKEAFRRSTSVYLVDRVLPMLPEKLSNELCSLRPLEDKLTFSAVFTFDKNNKIIDRWFGRTVIHSDKRFTYEEAQEVLENGAGEFAAELKKLNQVAGRLRKARFKNGAINFETEEVKFRLDEEGVPVQVYIKERKDAHLLVEDFMLLANKEVAIYIFNKGKTENQEIPFVYRIHDEPDPDRVAELVRFAAELGFEMHARTPGETANAYNKLAEAAEKDPGLKLLQPLAIRTMAKAVYSTKNIGHYGLGFSYYTHFTSPIRRYSDVLSHRVLAKNLEGSWRINQEKLEEECQHISRMERRAMDAERESVKYKQVEYLQKHIGDVFDGFVSGFSDRGIFIQLETNFCEGRVSFETMDEAFELSDSRLYVTGKRTDQKIKMGDKVKVKITDTDLYRRQVTMVFV
ncbi:MAG: ribonuclease R [Bacteroidetes bacterium]|nr:MAG: ribonuclease R [Bacteroidota bacterium]